ncbi:MAG: hypothetical protein IJT91_05380 [Clostridia bacterium]|nr:hypothetical protein [Clostridia bacterium]
MSFELRRRLLITAAGDPYKGGLKDVYERYVLDSAGALILCADGAYTSRYEGAAIDAMIDNEIGPAWEFPVPEGGVLTVTQVYSASNSNGKAVIE